MVDSYPDDVSRIVRALTLAGYPISRANAAHAWATFSESLCAGWLIMDGYDDAGIVEKLVPLWDAEYECWVFNPQRCH